MEKIMEKNKTLESISIDFHVHALNHKHYPVPAVDAELSEEDKWQITETLKAMKRVGRDAIVLADHNQLSSGIWAKEEGDKLGIKVIPGAEFSLFYKGNGIHVIAAGIETITSDLKDYFGYHTYPDRFVKLVEAAGGVTYMTHPQYYPQAFNDLLPYFHGYEEYNGGAEARGDCMLLKPDYLFEGFVTRGSDWHFGPAIHRDQVEAKSKVEPGSYLYEVFSKWL